jgi:hypothetical protein
MAFYRLNHFRSGRVVGGVDIKAEDDDEAVKLAFASLGDGPAELWSGPRKVRIFLPPPADQHSDILRAAPIR